MPDSSVPGLIAALGEAIGIPALRADAQGCCRLLFDGDRAVEIRCAPAQGRWLLSCALRGQRAEGPALQVLMQGNHMGAGFGGGWAGIDAQGLAVLHLPLALPEAWKSSLSLVSMGLAASAESAFLSSANSLSSALGLAAKASDGSSRNAAIRARFRMERA